MYKVFVPPPLLICTKICTKFRTLYTNCTHPHAHTGGSRPLATRTRRAHPVTCDAQYSCKAARRRTCTAIRGGPRRARLQPELRDQSPGPGVCRRHGRHHAPPGARPDHEPQEGAPLKIYLSAAQDAPSFDSSDVDSFTEAILDWWRTNGKAFPAWAFAARIVFGLTPNSAACERVFSL